MTQSLCVVLRGEQEVMRSCLTGYVAIGGAAHTNNASNFGKETCEVEYAHGNLFLSSDKGLVKEHGDRFEQQGIGEHTSKMSLLSK